MIEDLTSSIDAMSDDEFLRAIPQILELSARSRAYAARRWVTIKGESHRLQGEMMFNLKRRQERDR